MIHTSKLIHQGFSKKSHEPESQIKAFPAKMFQMQAGTTIGMADDF